MRTLRSLLPLAALAAGIFLCPPAACAADGSYSFAFSADDVEFRDFGLWGLHPEMKDCGDGQDEPGFPWLPQKMVSIAIPDGMVVASVDVKADWAVLRENIDIEPAQEPFPTNAKEPKPTPPDAAAYASADPYPAAAAVLEGNHRMRGRPFANVILRPLAYVAATKELRIAKTITVTLHYAPEGGDAAPAKNAGEEAPAAPVPAAPPEAEVRPGTSSLFDSMFLDLVVNPDEVASSSAPTGGAKGGEAVPTASDAQYLIITAPDLVDAFQELADFRAAFNGITTKVLSLDTVRANYSMARPDGGSDVQTAIRACVADYANSHGTEYVVLGGDDTVVPPRYINVKYSSYDEQIPADVYYGALDGTWDDDRDGVYAETSGDTFDFTYDVIPARIPVRTAAQATAYVRKLKRFELYTGLDDRDLLNRMLIAGEEHWSYYTNSLVNDRYVDRNSKGGSFTVGTSTYYNFNDGLPALQGRTTQVSDGELWGRQLKQLFFEVKQPGIQVLQAYDTAPGKDPATGAALKIDTTSTLDVGYHTILVMAHGSAFANAFGTSNASGTSGRQDFVLTDSCYTGAFDETKTPYYGSDPCLSEAYLRNASGGAVVYLGGSRYGWGQYGSTYGGASLTFMRNVYTQFYDNGNCIAGLAFSKIKSGLGQTYGTDRWNWCSINFQGDPLARFRVKSSIPSCVVETPVVSKSGSGLALSAKVTNLGSGAGTAAVTFELSYDDSSFQSPATVSGTTLSAPGTSTASLASIPAGTRVVYVRALVQPNVGASLRSRYAIYVVAIGGPPGDVLFVDANATGANTGYTWADAFTDIQDALAVCSENVMLQGDPRFEIWVAGGTYVPGSSSNSVYATPLGLEVYGGFAGTETERSQRDWIAHPTILSGEIGDPSSMADNVNTIVAGPSAPGFALWDGFVFTGAQGSAVKAVSSSETSAASVGCLVVDHSLFTGNRTSGTYLPAVAYGPLYLRNCVVTGNSYDYSYTYSGIFRTVNLDHCTVFGNTTKGGPVAYEGSFRNTIIWGNSVSGCSYHTGHNSYYVNNASWPFEGYGSTVWIAQSPQVKFGTHLASDPLFEEDPVTGLACALANDSPALDRATSLPWLKADSLDYLGHPRVYGDAPDLGAIEFYVSGPTAPEFLSVEPGAPDYAEIPVSATLKSLGNQNGWVDLEVQVSTSSSFSSIAARKTVRATAKKTPYSATVTGLSDNTTYYLRVVATGQNGLSATSSVYSFTTPNLALPAFTVSLSSAAPTRGTVALSIRTLGTGASRAAVSVSYSTSASFAGAETAALGDATATGANAFSGELTRLSQGTLYYVRVTLVNDKGRSATVDAGSFRTASAGGYAPGLMQVRYSCSGSSYPDFDITVATAADYSTYAVERAPGPFMADIYGNAGVKATNPYTGTEWDWQNYMTYYYEGEMFFRGGVTYNFFHCVDDGVAIELDGAWLTRQTASNESGFNKGVLKASKSFASDGWHKIRIWVYEWTGGKGYVEKHIHFTGVGIGWNTNGCTTVDAANKDNWSTLRDPGDASLLRTLSGDELPSFVELDDQPSIAGTTLSGTVRTDGVENGCTITLYAGHENCGSNTVGWTKSHVVGTVPSEEYVLPFQWDDFCDAGDYDGWYVIARMTNPSGSYEGWSLVRIPIASDAFVVGIREGESGLTTVSATPRVVGFGTGGGTASVCLQYSTDEGFADARTTAAVTASTTNWLSAVTISGLTPNTAYYVRTKGVKGGETVYSRAARLSTLDYGTPSASVSATVPSGETGLTTIQVSWSVSALGLGNTSAEVWLDYGTSASFGQSVKLDTVSGAKSGTYTLTGLAGETTYHFRVRVVAAPSGKVGTSSAGTAQTRPVGNPDVSATLGAVAQYAATLSYNLSALGLGAVSASLYCDVSTSSDFSGARSITIASGLTAPKVGTATATGLSAETTYYMRVRAVNHAGKVGTSATMTFTTTAVGDPEVAVDMTAVLQRAATASISIATLGEAAKSATVTLEYGTTTSYGKTATVSGTPGAGAVLSAELADLQPETTYYVRVTVKNDANKTGVATTSFTTLEPADPAFTYTVTPSYTAASFMLDVTKIGNGASSAAGYVRWGTSAASLTSGPAALPKIVEPGTMTGAATGLSAGTTYYYEVVVTNNLAGLTAKTGSFTTASAESLAWGEGYYQGGLLQGYEPCHPDRPNEAWGLDVSKASVQAARWNDPGFAPSFAYGAVASYQISSTAKWTNPYDGAQYPMDKWNRMWAYGGQMWMEKGVRYYFAVNFFYAASISIDGAVVVSEENGGNGTPQVGSVVPTTTGWHDIAVAVGIQAHEKSGAANNPWNTGSPFTSLRYGTAWNTNGLSSVQSSNASQWRQLLDAGDRHLFRARGNKAPMAFLDQEATWTASSVTVPVRLDTLYGGMSLTVYASRSPDAWYFADRWEETVELGDTGDAGAKTLDARFSDIDTTVDWYVSARLTDGEGYDYWTDPVKFTPQFVKQPPAGAVTVGTPNFTSNTATVNVTSLGDETGTVAVVLEYATDPAFADFATKTGTALSAPGSRDFSLTGLQPGRTYYVRARLTGSALNLETVTDAVSFTTPAYTPPVIASVAASSAGATSGTIVVDVSALGQGSQNATIKVYVSTGAFGETPDRTETIGAAGSTTFTINNLAQGTAYFVKVVVTGSNGLSATNTDASFVTGTVHPPSGTLAISGVGRAGATATATLESLGDSATSCEVAVEYATDAAFSSKKTVSGAAASAPGSQVLALSGLASETKYYARAVFTGTHGGEPLVGYSETVEFTTLGVQGPGATLEISSITFDGASATVHVATLGDDATSATVLLEIAGAESMDGATALGTQTIAKPGDVTFELSGLDPGTAYWLRATVTGRPSGLAATASASFSTPALGAPVLGEITTEAGIDVAKIFVPLDALGVGSGTVTLTVRIDCGDGCPGGDERSETFNETGTRSFIFAGLASGTLYNWSVVAVGENGLMTEASGTFHTAIPPLVLGPATVLEGDTGLYATMSVELTTLLYPPAEIVLELDGVAVRTWSGVEKPGAFSHTEAVEPGVAHVFRFIATASGRTAESGGRFATRAAVNWFHVRWGEDGYAAGPLWDVAAARSASGGAWTRPSGDGSEFDGARLRLAPPEEGVSLLRFAPSKAVKEGADITVEGSTVVSLGSQDLETPSGTRGGLVFAVSGPMGWTRDGWIPLKGAAPESGQTVAWKMEVSFKGANAPAIRYTVDGKILEDASGRQWLPLPASVSTVAGVGFAGAGSLCDFRGYYKTRIVGKFEKPEFGSSTPDGNALGFGVNAAGDQTFSVTIDNASADAVYGVYVCNRVDGDYVRDKSAVVTGSGEFLTFTVSAEGEDAQFVVIVAAEDESQLVDHLGDIEGLQ